MNYQEQLNPWVIHQLLPSLERAVVARFRRRNDADAYLKLISQMRPSGQFAIAFDVQDNQVNFPLETKGSATPKASVPT